MAKKWDKYKIMDRPHPSANPFSLDPISFMTGKLCSSPSNDDYHDHCQKIYRFPNGFGASVIRFWGSYGYDKGLWELAVIKFTSKEGEEVLEWDIRYDTPLTDDVLGHLTWDEVETTLQKIMELPKAEP